MAPVDASDAYWSLPPKALYQTLESSETGLIAAQARVRRARLGPNTLEVGTRTGTLRLLLRQFTSPLVLILVFAATVSVFVQDWTDAAIISVILLASGLTSFVQEYSANHAVEQLRARLAHRVSVLREGVETQAEAADIVPGDVVLLRAGTLVPADGVVIASKDLFVSQAMLTGETFPVEKTAGVSAATAGLAERTNCAFMGTSVRSGTGRLLIARRGRQTAFGEIADTLTLRPPETSFEQGVRRYSAMLSQVMVTLVIIVFTFNVLWHKPPIDSLLFAIALAVGISPELLPAIISITLSRGARAMARNGVIVRRLNAIENFGSMDVLCSDKTGTLTEGVIQLNAATDPQGTESAPVRELALLNAHFQTGIRNPLDEAILSAAPRAPTGWLKRDEIPYDFVRKRLSVVLAGAQGAPRLIMKGALAQVLEVCDRVRTREDAVVLDEAARARLERYFRERSEEGFRVLGVASADMPETALYTQQHERDLVFEGFLLFFDPPKQDARTTVRALARLGIRLKILTGDNRHVAAHVAKQVGLPVAGLLTGPELRQIRDEALWHLVERTDLFAELDPMQKERIIRALQKRGHIVGFLGDGINDAPALHDADVGISVDSAAEVAREAADLVLLKHDLDVLCKGVEYGRKTFANSIKYVLITTSANFGNMISMAAISLALPFLPLMATQILLNNFLSDIPALSIANDKVDREWVERPHRWDLAYLRRFMVVFGLVSSLFDFLTFGVLLSVFQAPVPMFRTAWFVESLLTELVVMLLLRTRQAVHRSRASRALLASTAAVAGLALALPYLPIGPLFGFVPLPWQVLAALLAIVLGYALTTEWVKHRFHRAHTDLTRVKPPRAHGARVAAKPPRR